MNWVLSNKIEDDFERMGVLFLTFFYNVNSKKSYSKITHERFMNINEYYL